MSLPCQSTETPTLSSTSIIRLTSSIFGMCLSVVVPRLINDAHSSATAPFFEELTSIDPVSFLPPSMRKLSVGFMATA